MRDRASVRSGTPLLRGGRDRRAAFGANAADVAGQVVAAAAAVADWNPSVPLQQEHRRNRGGPRQYPRGERTGMPQANARASDRNNERFPPNRHPRSCGKASALAAISRLLHLTVAKNPCLVRSGRYFDPRKQAHEPGRNSNNRNHDPHADGKARPGEPRMKPSQRISHERQQEKSDHGTDGRSQQEINRPKAGNEERTIAPQAAHST